MKCVILCGGKGMRMGELTEHLPKPLLIVGDKPILEHIMDHYAKYGITEFILCLGHLGDKIKAYFKNKNTGYKIEMVDTGEKSTKAQRLLKVKDMVKEEFFVSYSDDLSDVNISKLIEFHKKEKRIATLTAVRLNNPYGVIELDEFEPNIISNFKEKPTMKEWINGGYFLFDERIFDYIKENDELEKEVFEKLVKEKQIIAFRHQGFWKSVNNIKDYNELNEIFKNGKLGKIF